MGYIHRSGMEVETSCDMFVAGIASYMAATSWMEWVEEQNPRAIRPGCEILKVAAVPSDQAVKEAYFFAGGVVAMDPTFGRPLGLPVALAAVFRRVCPDEDPDQWINGTWAAELGWCLAAEADGSGMGWGDNGNPPHKLAHPPLPYSSPELFAKGHKPVSITGMKTRVIIVGPGAAGKDFLCRGLAAHSFTKAVSHTTRPPREGEEDGKDYHFTSEESFRARIASGYFLEWYSFGDKGWLYGTALSEYHRSNLFIMSPPVLSQLPKECREDALVVYLNIPERIRKVRLELRGDADKVERRLEADRKDFDGFSDFDLEVTSPNFDPVEVLENIRAVSRG